METNLSLRDNITFIHCRMYDFYYEEYTRIHARTNEKWRSVEELVEYQCLLDKLEKHLRDMEPIIRQGLK